MNISVLNEWVHIWVRMHVCRKLIKLLKRKCSKETREQKLAHTPWEKDYKLEPAANTSLFYEYLEMGQCLSLKLSSNSLYSFPYSIQ